MGSQWVRSTAKRRFGTCCRSKGSGHSVRIGSLLLLLVRFKGNSGAGIEIPPAVAATSLLRLWVYVFVKIDFVGWHREGRIAGAVLAQGPVQPDADAVARIVDRVTAVFRRRLPLNGRASWTSAWFRWAGGGVMEMVTRLSTRSTLIPAHRSGRAGIAPRTQSARASAAIACELQAIDEPLFRDILIREWRRADRFDQSFVLVLVRIEFRSDATSWDEIIEALGSH